MTRNRNTNVRGGSFDLATIEAVWKKGRYISGQGGTEVRADICGSHMIRNQYGNTDSVYGWEVDHIIPVAKNGTDDIGNLQPLQWDNNRKKGDTYPWHCA